MALRTLYQPRSRQPLEQPLSLSDARSTLQKSLAVRRVYPGRELLKSDQLPRLKTASPPSLFRIVLVKPPPYIGTHPNIVAPRRNTPEHINIPLQKTGAVDQD